jgi:hypothetical protein
MERRMQDLDVIDRGSRDARGSRHLQTKALDPVESQHCLFVDAGTGTYSPQAIPLTSLTRQAIPSLNLCGAHWTSCCCRTARRASKRRWCVCGRTSSRQASCGVVKVQVELILIIYHTLGSRPNRFDSPLRRRSTTRSLASRAYWASSYEGSSFPARRVCVGVTTQRRVVRGRISTRSRPICHEGCGPLRSYEHVQVTVQAL